MTGEVLFKLNGEELKTELQNVLYDLVREGMPQWKQMRSLQVISALVAETLIEMGVLILTEPAEIHWPNGMITKPVPLPRGKKGKKTQKNKHGIYGELVSSLAPSIPPQSASAACGTKSKSMQGGKPFKPPTKKAVTNKCKEAMQETQPAEVVDNEEDENNAHQGLPVQGRRSEFSSLIA